MSDKESGVRNFILSKIVQDRPAEESMPYYNEWAEKYDNDLVACEYRGPQFIVAEFGKLNFPKDARILDVGAGTGWVGIELKKLGYDNIDALDGSREMLNEAKKKPIYKNHFETLVLAEQRLPFEDNAYDAVLCAGSVVPGHIAVDDLIDVIRVVKPGGIISWTVSFNYEDRNEKWTKNYIDKVINEWQKQGKWSIVEGYPVNLKNYKKGFECTIYTLRVK